MAEEVSQSAVVMMVGILLHVVPEEVQARNQYDEAAHERDVCPHGTEICAQTVAGRRGGRMFTTAAIVHSFLFLTLVFDECSAQVVLQKVLRQLFHRRECTTVFSIG